jgi:plasmid stability protein
MKASLSEWIGNTDALVHRELFLVRQETVGLAHVRGHIDDYYLSLIGELFDRMRSGTLPGPEWARIGNALAQIATLGNHGSPDGISADDVTLFAATAFYCGGFPASAYLTAKALRLPEGAPATYRACLDLLTRPYEMTSRDGQELLRSLRNGRLDVIEFIQGLAAVEARATLSAGPDEWIPARLFEKLMERFAKTNIRAVLPVPEGSADFWGPLVKSMLDRVPATWEFFPSQIEAIERGLLQRPDSFALQMPTGAGKTALCETLLYWHSKQSQDEVAILLVPYRSLAAELRASVVRRLNSLGIQSRCAYGGTVPSGDEVGAMGSTRVVVATPESLLGLLGADAAFLNRVSLVICDEGHLLDGGARGVALELLLTRMRSRAGGPPKFVFVSAIVPNIEEINAWLGGSVDSVVRSDYRPALAEFALLRAGGPMQGTSYSTSLEMHPHELSTKYSIEGFLAADDFRYVNPETGRMTVYPFKSVKAQAIAAARKALPMGGVAVFAANKGGDQGVVGLVNELLKQLGLHLRMPKPIDFSDQLRIFNAALYLESEFGLHWTGARALRAGAALHHGDVPQEAREVLETLLREGATRLAICTNTLAEGVNLPIRTLVLYSVKRMNKSGRAEDLLTRDIKNLVGRAGRPGSTTKGLVICANEKQWPLVKSVALQSPGEPVRGALRALVVRVRDAVLSGVSLTNPVLENTPELHTLVDGIDATLIDLAAEEVGVEQLVELATQLAEQTFASSQADLRSRQVLQDVFRLRAQHVAGIRASGRLGWIRETGARARILAAVEHQLLPLSADWDELIDQQLGEKLILDWAWTQADLQSAVRKAYRLEADASTDPVRGSFMSAVSAWLDGSPFHEMAARGGREIDELLAIHSNVIVFILQTLVEQSVALLAKLLESHGRGISEDIARLPERLRFGAPSVYALVLASQGVRHRRACVQLGLSMESRANIGTDRTSVLTFALASLQEYPEQWSAHLGKLVFDNALSDVSAAIENLR